LIRGHRCCQFYFLFDFNTIAIFFFFEGFDDQGPHLFIRLILCILHLDSFAWIRFYLIAIFSIAIRLFAIGGLISRIFWHFTNFSLAMIISLIRFRIWWRDSWLLVEMQFYLFFVSWWERINVDIDKIWYYNFFIFQRN
jgi:hypothetical protein